MFLAAAFQNGIEFGADSLPTSEDEQQIAAVASAKNRSQSPTHDWLAYVVAGADIGRGSSISRLRSQRIRVSRRIKSGSVP